MSEQEMTFSQRVIQEFYQFLSTVNNGLIIIPRPGGDDDWPPTMVGAPDDMSGNDAAEMCVQATRWQEFANGQLMQALNKVSYYVECFDQQKALLLVRHKKPAGFPEEDLKELNAISFIVMQAKVEARLLDAEVTRLKKVYTAASRVLTRATKLADVGGFRGE